MICTGKLADGHVNCASRRLGSVGDTGEIFQLCDFILRQLAPTAFSERQVKRMFGAIEHPVLKLSRLSIGGVEIDPALPEGGWRELTKDEIAQLKSLSGMGG